MAAVLKNKKSNIAELSQKVADLLAEEHNFEGLVGDGVMATYVKQLAANTYYEVKKNNLDKLKSQINVMKAKIEAGVFIKNSPPDKNDMQRLEQLEKKIADYSIKERFAGENPLVTEMDSYSKMLRNLQQTKQKYDTAVAHVQVQQRLLEKKMNMNHNAIEKNIEAHRQEVYELTKRVELAQKEADVMLKKVAEEENKVAEHMKKIDELKSELWLMYDTLETAGLSDMELEALNIAVNRALDLPLHQALALVDPSPASSHQKTHSIKKIKR